MIHQIFISDEIDPNEDMQHSQNRKKFMRVYKDEEYKLWRHSDLQEFLAQHYPRELIAFNKVKAYSFKADLAKFIVINHFGGWYYDFYTDPVFKLDVSNLEMVLFRDIPYSSSTSFPVACNIFYSVKNNPVLKTAINIVVKNINNQYYGGNSLCPTSVVPFGMAVAMHGYNSRHYIGDYKEIDGRKVSIFPDGQIFAIGKNNMEGGQINLAGTNNYNYLWNNRILYGEAP